MCVNMHLCHERNLLFLSIFVASVGISLCFEGRNPEVEALVALRNNLNDPNGVLKNWDVDSVDPCSWAMITCSPDNLVTALIAPGQGLSGTLSGFRANLTNLKQMLLQNNNISGHIPKEIGKLPNLQTLDLSNNEFSGHVPETLGFLNNLQYLRLNNNSLSGAIPLSLSRVPKLAFLDLSYNNFSVPVPTFTARTFNIVGNPLVCGSLSSGTCNGSLNTIPLSIILNTSGGRNVSKRLAIALSVSCSCVSLFLLGMSFIFWKRSNRRRLSILNVSDLPDEELVKLGNLRSFGFKELQLATDSFSSKNILGAGGFGNVYRGKFGDGSLVAVKRLKDINGTAGESQFQTELELISLAVHRNLLRLIGYCATPTERLLVYPYMSNGSVAARLRGKPPLDWYTRKRIAIGAARGLLYLHEQCDPKIIHRDVKAANVLLDEYYEAIVGDFGLAKLLDHAESHVTTAVRGTVGHIAPEYLSTGQSSEKTDVFGFGILLVELITGMRALELGKSVNQKGAALEWVNEMQREKNFDALVDRELGSNYDKIEVGEMLQVAILCTQYLPAHRPKMSEVVRMLEGDGLAEKWAASHNYDRHTPLHLSKVPGYDDNDYDHIPIFGTMMDDDGYDAHAMELSGPR